MGRVTYGFLGALTVLLIHSASWAQQPTAPGPVDPGAAAAGPGLPAQGVSPVVPQAQPGAQPLPPPSAPAYGEAGPPAYQAPQPNPHGQAAPSPYPPQGYAPPTGYRPSYSQPPYPPSYAPPPPPPSYRPYGYPYARPYGYAPARPYYGYPAAPYVPARAITDRPFELRLGVGFSSLRYTDVYGDRIEDEAGGNWNLQIGFGLAPRLVLLFGIDEVLVGGSDTYTYGQTAITAGLQVFLFDRLYLRGGLGLGVRSASSEFDSFSNSNQGWAGLVGLGLELVQGYHWALYGEWDVIGTYFPKDEDKWVSNTLGLGIAFF